MDLKIFKECPCCESEDREELMGAFFVEEADSDYRQFKIYRCRNCGTLYGSDEVS